MKQIYNMFYTFLSIAFLKQRNPSILTAILRMRKKANHVQQDIINKVAQLAHYLNNVFKSVSFKIENFTKQIDSYCHNYHKRMPISNKANRYIKNDNSNRGNKRNHSNDLNKQTSLFDPFLNAAEPCYKQPENSKQFEKDLWQIFKQVQVEYLTRNYPLEKKQIFHKFALSKFQQMTPQQAKRYIAQMQRLPLSTIQKREQNEDFNQYTQQYVGLDEQFLKNTSKKEKLRQKINFKDKKKTFQDHFFCASQIDEGDIFLNIQQNESNQLTGLKGTQK